jgi:hypothetical protein
MRLNAEEHARIVSEYERTHKETLGAPGRQTDSHTDRQADRQTGRQTDIKTETD